MANLETFELFPNLPPELRHKILIMAIPPRVVQIEIYFPIARMAIIPPVPALLHTSRETREIATKHYRPVWLDDKSNFNNTMLALLVRNSEKYIDYQQDTLYYGAEDPPAHGMRFLEVQ